MDAREEVLSPPERTVYIDPRTNEPCRRCGGTGFMSPWPNSKGSVSCGICRAALCIAAPQAAVPESQDDDIVRLGSLNNEEFRPKAIELIIATRAKLDYFVKLAHENERNGLRMRDEGNAKITTLQAQIANLTKEANKEETRCK